MTIMMIITVSMMMVMMVMVMIRSHVGSSDLQLSFLCVLFTGHLRDYLSEADLTQIPYTQASALVILIIIPRLEEWN
eukprot:800964-Karenia_brevis.AAC.1